MLHDVDKDYVWIISLFVNIFNYSTVLVPGYLVFRYMKSSKYLENAGNLLNYFIFHYIISNLILDMGCFPSIVRLCLGDNDDEHSQNPLTSSSTTAHQRTAFEEAVLLIFCFLGLQVSYLSWGVLQEKVMTQVLTKSMAFLHIAKI